MSVEAITWALGQPVPQSSTKFVLVVLANCASAANNLAYPSVAYMCEATGQNRKTIMTNLQRLAEQGLVEDSGERRGRTGQIVVYRLRIQAQRNGDQITERHYCYRSEDPATGRYYLGVRTCLGEPSSDAGYVGSGKWITTLAATGTKPRKTVISVFASRVRAEDAERELIAASIDDPLCMNRVVPPKRTEIGTISNNTVFGTVGSNDTENGTVKESRKVPETVPFFPPNSTENGTRNRQEPKRNKEREPRSPSGSRLPLDWQPSEADIEFAKTGRPDLGWKAEADKFRDYWHGVAGADARKADWSATWRNWIRRADTPKGAVGQSITASAPAPPARDWRAGSESKLENELAYIRSQFNLGVYGEGQEAEIERDRLIDEARGKWATISEAAPA